MASHPVQAVCNTFVEQYYLLLHRKPEIVCNFYRDLSTISRPEPDGSMSSVSSMHGINEKILSLNYNSMKIEIKTADPLQSHNGGVLVLVTGFVTGLDNMKRKFAQTFFLAPQEIGYFVLSDVFRYIDDDAPMETLSIAVNASTVDHLETDVSPVQNGDRTLESDVPEHAGSVTEDVSHNEEMVGSQSEKSYTLQEEESSQAPSSQNEVGKATGATPEDVPKKSYASIVRVTKENKLMNTSVAPNCLMKVTSVKIEKKTSTTAASSSEGQGKISTTAASSSEGQGKISTTAGSSSEGLASPPTPPVANGDNAPESSSHHDEAESHSIYVRGLPLTLAASQLEEVFKKFGPIKTNGVQVRSKQGFCFGFVAFNSASSVQKALEASPVLIMGKKAFVEEKRGSASQVNGGGSGRGRFSSSRGGSNGAYGGDFYRGRSHYEARGLYAGDGFGNRGNNNGNRGNDHNNRRGEYGNRARGLFARNGYQRVDQNGRNEMATNGGMKQATVAA